MNTSVMKYPFGRCIACGMEFNSELVFSKFQEGDDDPCEVCGIHSEAGCMGCLKK